jgi:hypothetical protein
MANETMGEKELGDAPPRALVGVALGRTTTSTAGSVAS